MFNPNSPLDDRALTEAKALEAIIPNLKPRDIERIYLHWSAEDWSCESTSYNLMVFLENDEWKLKIETPFQNNAESSFSENYAAHTWHRNDAALGVCVSGMSGNNVGSSDFGSQGVQLHEIEVMCAGAAVLCKAYDVLPLEKVTIGRSHVDNNNKVINTLGEHIILTHAEVAVLDSYANERWDLGVLEPLPNGVNLTPEIRSATGDLLRERINKYMLAL